ncbi:unnamed protein product [Danaus chrysippus]|uniref:(African queen) hypothetical protein n=1 Tax=Danaus chrysippus TaxID=151541 RepID=A0A8J2R1Q2_9NEOP|nr:unnamed protein product [Danaus chrysippus]
MATKLNDLDTNELANLFETWGMKDFVDFVKEKRINGRSLPDVSELMVELWRPNCDAHKLMTFIKDMEKDPKKYLNRLKNYDVIKVKETNLCSESQYQTVSVRKVSQQETTSHNTVEEILKKVTAPKSFLYRHAKRQEKSLTSYLPMDAGTEKKSRKFFRLSSYDYPIFDLKIQFPKVESCTDRGYYFIKPSNKTCAAGTCKTGAKPKYKSLVSQEELNDKLTEDHLYEDLCYNEINVDKKTESPRVGSSPLKPCMVKIHGMLQLLRLPFFRKSEVTEEKKSPERKISSEKDRNVYENSSMNMYDSIHVARDSEEKKNEKHWSLEVEDYLEPVQLHKDYCDVSLKEKDDSFLNYILNYFENRLRRRETNDTTHSEGSETEPSGEQWEKNVDMTARPLPVPVENESYYFNVDRSEAENLLMGQPDGTFILRPSSQSNHAYTLTVSCSNSVHNVGVRRRPDGRLALGFARKGERSFTSVTSLLRHHKKRRLLLVAGGGIIGGTTLNETPQYYQVPSNIPVISDARVSP